MPTVASGRMRPVNCVEFLAEWSGYQIRVWVAYLKISRGATLSVSVLEAKIGCSWYFSFAYVLGYFFFLSYKVSVLVFMTCKMDRDVRE